MSGEISPNIPIDQNELYKVSLEGDVVGLKRLLEQDELVLDRLSAVTSFNETPLHIAAMRGHFDFARELLHCKPQFAGESDSLLRLPLHWAAEKGYTNIVTELLQQRCPNHACLSWRDQDGKIPLHLAAMKGRNDVVNELIRARPESIFEKVENGGTILHLCVKYNRLEVLKMLMDTTQARELVNEKDVHGNTILHLAAIFKQVEITKYLVSESIGIDANANDFTALDTIEHSPMDMKALEIKNILLEAGIEKKTNNPPSSVIHSTPSSESSGCFRNIGRKCKKLWNTYTNNFSKILEGARGHILVAATVTATLTFQAGINPPDFAKKGADNYQQEQQNNTYNVTYLPNLFFEAGTGKYGFWYYNTLSLLYSFLTILFMISGIPFRNNFSSLLLVFIMVEVVVNIAQVYILAAHSNINPEKNQREYNLVESALFVMAYLIPVVYWLIILIHAFNLVMYLVFKFLKYVKKCIVCFCLKGPAKRGSGEGYHKRV